MPPTNLSPEVAAEWARAFDTEAPTSVEEVTFFGLTIGYTYRDAAGDHGYVTTTGLICPPAAVLPTREEAAREAKRLFDLHQWGTPHGPAECWICCEFETAVLVHGPESGPRRSSVADMLDHLDPGSTQGPAGMVIPAALASYNEVYRDPAETGSDRSRRPTRYDRI